MVGERTGQPTYPGSPEAAAQAKALQAKEAELTAAIAAVHVLAAALGPKALVILSSLGSAAFFGWAVYSGSSMSLLAASIFTVLVFLPALYASRN